MVEPVGGWLGWGGVEVGSGVVVVLELLELPALSIRRDSHSDREAEYSKLSLSDPSDVLRQFCWCRCTICMLQANIGHA